MQITTFWPGDNQLGEGPHWDETRQCLWWVDILGKTIFRADATGDSVQQWPVPELVGFALPRPDGTMWLGYQSGLHVGQLHPNGTLTVDRTDTFMDDADRLRFNDGCVDKNGNLYATTMDMRATEPLGQLRRYDYLTGSMAVLTGGFTIGNGPALSPDQSLLCVVETIGHAARPKGVYVAQLTGAGLTGEHRLIDWPATDTSPDGVSTDGAGNLWVGEWGGSTLRQFSPGGTQLQAIELPVLNPTKAALDPHRNTLFVTSARDGLTDGQLAQHPLTGSVLAIEVD